MARTMTDDQMKRLARLGAAARLEQLQEELTALRAAFPGLGATRGRKPAAPAAKATAPRKRRKMSAANRKAVSERMSKYWADRRRQKGQKSKG